MIFKRATIPLIIAFVMGLLGFVLQYIPHPVSNDIQEEIASWFKIIGGFGIIIGAYSLLHMHISRIRRKVPGWGYSVFVFLGAALMVLVGVWDKGMGPLAQEGAKGAYNDWFNWGYNFVLVPCQATIFSILAFFMASAAFRTFRARNLAAAMLLVSAILVMFGRVPVSETVSQWFPKVADILMEYPNLAAKRGIMLGISLGVISQSLRILLGIERSYLGGGE